MQKNLCGGFLFNEIAGKNSRPAILIKKPPTMRFTCDYIRTFSALTETSYKSSGFLITLRTGGYRQGCKFIKTLVHH